jgi:hypothetical protein
MAAITQVPNNVYKSSEYFQIRKDLIDWLSNQDEFKDYDFAGSRMSVLIDLLAYNTLYIQHYTNTATYESFIRTAKLRSSVIQHAQDMGYLPDSRTASSTEIAVQVRHPSSPTHISIPKGTKFVGVVDKTYPYDFVTWEDATVQVDIKDKLYKTRLDLVQGRVVRQSFDYGSNTRILVQNPTIDRNYVRVYVDNDEWTDWTNNSIININGLSNVFYMRETLEGFTEIYFGEGESSFDIAGDALQANYIGGLRPQVGSTVTIEYISTAGEEANGARQIQYVDSLKDLEFTLILENPDEDPNYTGTSGGGDQEDVERIRELAPIFRESQRRCVTASDYEAFLSYRFGSIVQAIQAFTDSGKPGYAFIAIKPKEGLTLTSVQKEDMQNFLKQYNVATITPVIMDPKYMYVKHNINVQYKLNNLHETEEWLKGKVVEAIDRYYIEHVELFNKSFHASKLLTYVDNADQSILGSTIDIHLIREEDNFYKTPMAGIKFLNAIEQQSMISSHFSYTNERKETYNIRYASTSINNEDNQSGKIVIGPFKSGDISIPEYTAEDFVRDPNEPIDRNKYYAVGTIDYTLDKIDFDLGILNRPSDRFGGAYIELEVKPVDKNIYVKDGSLIVFENDLRPQYTTINLEPIAL